MIASKVYPLTPPEFFAPLHERFRFTVDAAAEPYNAVLPRFWTPEDDGLKQSWADERVWCNPPYDDIEPWLVKAWDEIEAELIVMLLPADRTWEAWWQNQIEPERDKGDGLRTEFLPGRMEHIIPVEGSMGYRPYGHVLAIFD